MGNNDNMALHTEKSSNNSGVATTPDFTVKAGLAQMLKGGVIMDVVNAEQVKSLCIFVSFYLRVIYLCMTSIISNTSLRRRE